MGVAVEGLWLGLAEDPLAISLMSAAQGDMGMQPVKTFITRYADSLCLSMHDHHTLLLKFCFVSTIATCECPLCAKAFVLSLSLLVSTMWVPHRTIH